MSKRSASPMNEKREPAVPAAEAEGGAAGYASRRGETGARRAPGLHGEAGLVPVRGGGAGR